MEVWGIVNNVVRGALLRPDQCVFLDEYWQNSPDRSELHQAVFELIAGSKLILWRNDLFFGVLESAEAFAGTRVDITDFDYPNTFHVVNSFPRYVDNRKRIHIGTLVTINTFLERANLRNVLGEPVVDDHSSIMAFSISTMLNLERKVWDTLYIDPLFRMDDGSTVPEDSPATETLACNAFIKTKVATIKRERLPRGERRRMARKGGKEPEIYAVHLRRPEKREKQGDREPIEHDCCWTVRGHWRKQWYPSVEAHKAIWIDGYVKGDTSKPMLRPKSSVFVVDR